MSILAIDPGPEKSAWIVLDGGRAPFEFDIQDNRGVLRTIDSMAFVVNSVAIEMVESFGKPVGEDVFETAYWIGKFSERADSNDFRVDRIKRSDVKKHLCKAVVGVNDSVIRQALIDRYGPGKEKAIGRKKTPGPLYGIKKDIWQALAVAVTHYDRLAMAEGA